MSTRHESLERLIEFEERDMAILQERIKSLQADLREECDPFMEPHWESKLQLRIEICQRKLDLAQANIAALKWSLDLLEKESQA